MVVQGIRLAESENICLLPLLSPFGWREAVDSLPGRPSAPCLFPLPEGKVPMG